MRYDWPVRTGLIIGRLDDSSRFLALTDDLDLVGLLSDGEPIVVRPSEKDNRAALA